MMILFVDHLSNIMVNTPTAAYNAFESFWYISTYCGPVISVTIMGFCIMNRGVPTILSLSVCDRISLQFVDTLLQVFLPFLPLQKSTVWYLRGKYWTDQHTMIHQATMLWTSASPQRWMGREETNSPAARACDPCCFSVFPVLLFFNRHVPVIKTLTFHIPFCCFSPLWFVNTLCEMYFCLWVSRWTGVKLFCACSMKAAHCLIHEVPDDDDDDPVDPLLVRDQQAGFKKWSVKWAVSDCVRLAVEEGLRYVMEEGCLVCSFHFLLRVFCPF